MGREILNSNFRMAGNMNLNRESTLITQLRALLGDEEPLIAELIVQLDELLPILDPLNALLRALDNDNVVTENSVFVGTTPLVNTGPQTLISAISTPIENPDAVKGEQCPICLASLTAEGAVKLEACGHIVGVECMSTWINSPLENCNTCCICRRELFLRRPCDVTGLLQQLEEFNTASNADDRLALVINLLHALKPEIAALLGESAPGQISPGP